MYRFTDFNLQVPKFKSFLPKCNISNVSTTERSNPSPYKSSILIWHPIVRSRNTLRYGLVRGINYVRNCAKHEFIISINMQWGLSHLKRKLKRVE